ncbi:efflux RND transporter periplasmic adaptor subunit [bacterium]|nr:efflux RND transporter periplasmic adaptor subunit [bacterium]
MKMFKVVITVTVSICVLSLLLGCGKKGGAESNHNSADSSAVADSSATGDSSSIAENDTSDVNLDLIPVEVAEVKEGEIASYLLLSSTIETENIVDVYPLVGGVIEKIFVEEAMWVKKGQPLLQIEDDQIALNEQQARVDYEQQLANYERLQMMHEQKLVADEDFETAHFILKQAEIAWQKVKLTRERTNIKAPISGLVTERLVYDGNLVSTATKLFTITDPTEKICKVWVPERDLMQMRVGQKAYISSQISTQDRFTGWIKRISPVIDRSTGTCKVTIGIKDPKNNLRSGMFVRTEIIIDTHQNAVLVPKNALFFENGIEWVYAVEESIAVKRRVKIGFSNGNRFEALLGVSPGEQVVVVGQTTLKDSAGIRVVDVDSTLTMALGQADK